MLHQMSTAFLLVMILSQAAHSQDELLNFLIEQNAAAKEKIKTAEYTVKWTQDLSVKDGIRHNEGVGQVKLKGEWRRSTQECNASIPATGWNQHQTPSMVMNDRYVGYWPHAGNPSIYREDHQSLRQLPANSKLMATMHTTPDLQSFDVAFGGEKGTTFREMLALHPDNIRWAAEEVKQPNGDSVYHIKRFSPFMRNSRNPDAVWTIDPQKGFLVTHTTFYSRSGNEWVTRTIDAKEMGDGIWIPASYRESRYGEPDAPQPITTPDQTVVELKDVSLNTEVSDELFEVESLLSEESRASTTLVRKGLDGKVEAYVYRNGGYISRDIVKGVDDAMVKAVEQLDMTAPLDKGQAKSHGSEHQGTDMNDGSSENSRHPTDIAREHALPTYVVIIAISVAIVASIGICAKISKSKKDRT